ncbi:MAG: proline--tRNA ligase [Candidatus Aenigmarchaeota archaeon]|nr:proline--tRNA ligase [Candidatus Aenigmarchaeota archaeon]
MVEKPRNLTPKSENFSEWYLQILSAAELVEDRYNVKGFYIMRPWLMEIVDRIYSVWEKELKEKGHGKVLFPTVIPEENFEKEKEHVEGFTPEVFWITEAGGTKFERKLALRPTSETAMYSVYPYWVRSHEDLPLKCFQSCSVFRYETKATKPLIRLREFLWIEAHDAFATEEEALAQVKSDMDTTATVLNHFNVPVLFFRRPDWDKFNGAVSTFAADTMLPDGKRLQLPSTHYLGQNFSKAFGIKFTDKDEQEKFVHQTCYGPPISRTAATIISLHSDDFGLSLPFSVAPIQIVIVPILKKGSEEAVLCYAKEISERLKEYFVKIDDRDESPGSKFYKWEIRGVPVRLEVGLRETEEKTVSIFRRDKREKSQAKIEDMEQAIKAIEKSIEENLCVRAKEYFKERIFEAETIDGLKEKIEKGFVKVPFCSREIDGKACAETLKEIAEIAGTVYPDEENTPSGARPQGKKCIACGREAKEYVYCCRSY